MNPSDIIKHKRENKKLTREQLEYFIEGYLKGEITDYQMSALLMCIHFNKMDEEETFHLTDLMLKSGKIVDLSFIEKIKVDKHSTGGVGDKTSIILAPLVADCGIAVPMISGRGLGHTGGTIDKLESIPGFKINYNIEDYKKIISKTGVVMSGQTDELAPADKKIYSLRDVTSTVDNISLITASIMSKKLAEGADALVFDIKIGRGANLPDKEQSELLARTLLKVAKKFNKKAIAVLTDMEEPLGYKIGNWLEIEECIEVMNGEKINDLCKLTNVLAGAMLFIGGKAKNLEEGEKMAQQKMQDGSAFKKFLEMVKTQEGDVKYVLDWKNLKRAEYKLDVISDTGGYISKLDAFHFGKSAVELGCGRKKKTDVIDNLAGIILRKKTGDRVSKNDVICELYSSDIAKNKTAEKIIKSGIEITNRKPGERKLILDILYQ